MKVAVCGSGKVFSEEVSKKAYEIGREIALLKGTLLTGACNGYPYSAAEGASSAKGEVIGYSPAKDLEEHTSKYGFPTTNFSSFVFTGNGIPGRNLDLIKAADAVILVDGKVGTLNEFTLAFHYGKKICVLLGSGGICEIIGDIAPVIDKNGEKENIIYEKDVKKLISSIFA